MPASIPWEVVVVNNASTDDTVAVATRLWREVGAPTSLNVLAEPTPGLSNARACGIANSRYGVVVFVDDDNWLDPDFLKIAFEVMSWNVRIGILGGDIRAYCEVEPPGWFEIMESYLAVGKQGRAPGDITDYKPHVAGAGMVLRKSAYEELKRRSFKFLLSDRKGKQLTGGGDIELCLAIALIGYRIWYDPRLRLTHFLPKTRLTKAYLREMVRDMDAAGNVMALYDMALAQDTHGTFFRFLAEIKTRSWWAAKSAAKLVLGRYHPFAFELELAKLSRRLVSFPKLRSIYRKHFGELQRLMKN